MYVCVCVYYSFVFLTPSLSVINHSAMWEETFPLCVYAYSMPLHIFVFVYMYANVTLICHTTNFSTLELHQWSQSRSNHQGPAWACKVNCLCAAILETISNSHLKQSFPKLVVLSESSHSLTHLKINQLKKEPLRSVICDLNCFTPVVITNAIFSVLLLCLSMGFKSVPGNGDGSSILGSPVTSYLSFLSFLSSSDWTVCWQ